MTELQYRKGLQDQPMDGFNIRMTAWHARICRKAGNGNMAAGARMAIELLATHLENINRPPIANTKKILSYSATSTS